LPILGIFIGNKPLITIKTLRIYQEFNGDIDGYARSGRHDDPSDATDRDWRLIDELRQALFIIASGLASTDFQESTEQKIITSMADEQTRAALRHLAGKS